MATGKAITLKNQSLDILTLGNTLAQSGYFSDTREAAQAIVKVLAGQELGLGPIASMTGIHIIQGKPSLSANAMAAVIKNHPTYDYRVIELSHKICKLQFFADGEKIGVSEFGIQDAQQAGLTSGKNSHSWKNYPRNMLFARAMSNGAKWFCPDAFSGVPPYTPDEFDVVVDGESGDIVEAQETPDNELEFEQWLESENRADETAADTAKAFYEKCQADIGVTPEIVDEILDVYKVKKFNPDRADKYYKAIESQLTEPTCEPALLWVVQCETQNYYDNIFHLKNAVMQMVDNFTWPKPLKNPDAWKIARKNAIDHANAHDAVVESHPFLVGEPEQEPLFPDEAPEPPHKYE